MTLRRTSTGEPIRQASLVVGEVMPPAEAAGTREASVQFQRNSFWLQQHWGELLPQARGKHLAVAGQEAFLADSAAEAIARARAAHPEDKGIHVYYLPTHQGPLIYAICG